MHNFSLRIILITSLLWGIGYPNFFRIPLYIYIIIASVILSNSFRIDNLRNILKSFNINKFFKSNKINYLYFLLLLIYFFTWKTFSIIYMLIIISFTLFCSYFIKTEDITSKDWFYNSLVITVSLAAISVPFVGPFNQYVSASPSLYPEPSSLGFTMGPILGLLTFKKGYRTFGIFGILFFNYFCFSRSLWIGYLFTSFINRKFNHKLSSPILASGIFCLFIFSVSVLFFFVARIENVFSIDNGIIQYSSILVWYGWLKYSLQNLIQYPFGMGPFGWIELINYLDPLNLCHGEVICKINGSITTSLNQRDLASFTSFGFASFGLFFPLLLYSFINYFCHFKITCSKLYFKLNPLSILIISYTFTFMFRWTGLTAGPLLGVICLFLALKSNNKRTLIE